MAKAKKSRRTIHLDDADWAFADKVAFRLGMGTAVFIRQLVKLGLREHRRAAK